MALLFNFVAVPLEVRSLCFQAILRVRLCEESTTYHGIRGLLIYGILCMIWTMQ